MPYSWHQRGLWIVLATVSRNDATEQAKKGVCICCPTAVFQLFRSSNTGGGRCSTILRAALDGAVRDGLLARNPAALIKRPGIERTEARHLDGDGVTAVLKAAETSRYHPALVLIAATGLRKGEALALRWDRVDLDAGTLKVSATISRVDRKLIITEPKTARSRRTVPMPSAVVSMLRKHRTEQKAERLRSGNQWTDSGLVFTTEFGGPVEPATCCA